MRERENTQHPNPTNKMGNKVSLEDELVNLRITSKQMQRSAKKCQKNEKAAFNFVAKRYDSEPDSLYPVSAEDLRRYYDAHKSEKKYEQKRKALKDLEKQIQQIQS